MLEKEIVTLLNYQINLELRSAYLYLGIANYYYSEGLEGFANWFQIQTQEELDHAKLLIIYLGNNNETIQLADIKASEQTFSDPKKPLLLTLKHEQSVTAAINHIYNEASMKKDFRTLQFLEWFIKEQGEEEKNSEDLIKKFELFAGDSKGLYLLNAEMKTRAYTPPSLAL